MCAIPTLGANLDVTEMFRFLGPKLEDNYTQWGEWSSIFVFQ